MKSFNKKIVPYIIGVTSSVIFFSCSKSSLDNVNYNRNNPLTTPSKYIITDAITSTAFNVVGGDLSLYSSVYIEQEAGVWNQMWNAEMRNGDPTQSSTYNNDWNSIYTNIKNLKIVLTKTSSAGDEYNNFVTRGIAQLLLAYNAGVLTDFFGDVPYSQAGVVDAAGNAVYPQPILDKQSAVYDSIQALLDSSIINLAKTDASAIGTQDLIYGSSSAKVQAANWTKAAYGLKARYLMHTLHVSSDVTTDLNNIVSFINKSFTSSDDELKFAVYDGSNQNNPLYSFSNARDALGVSQSLAQKFTDLSDPRGDLAFMNYSLKQISLATALANSVPNGNAVQQQYVYPISIAEYASSAPTNLLSYHELQFLKAEALVRLGNTTDGSSALQLAIESAFSNLENTIQSTASGQGVTFNSDLSDSVADAYFKSYVTPRFASNPLKEVVLQKYLGMYGASGEATEEYNDYRRLNAMGVSSYIGLANPLNSSKFPLRFTYGNSDVLANPNIKTAYGDGSYVYTENVWWAGGTR